MSESAPPPLPPVHELPQAAIERWGSIPAAAIVEVPVSKAMLDHLMMSLRRMTFAQMSLGDAFAAHTRGEMNVANDLFIKHQLNIRDAYSDINRFIEAVMQNAAHVDG